MGWVGSKTQCAFRRRSDPAASRWSPCADASGFLPAAPCLQLVGVHCSAERSTERRGHAPKPWALHPTPLRQAHGRLRGRLPAGPPPGSRPRHPVGLPFSLRWPLVFSPRRGWIPGFSSFPTTLRAKPTAVMPTWSRPCSGATASRSWSRKFRRCRWQPRCHSSGPITAWGAPITPRRRSCAVCGMLGPGRQATRSAGAGASACRQWITAGCGTRGSD